MLLGDSLVKGLNEYGLSRNQNVKITNLFRTHHRRYVRHVKPAARHEPDVNMTKIIRKIVKSIRNCSENMQVLSSRIIN